MQAFQAISARIINHVDEITNELLDLENELTIHELDRIELLLRKKFFDIKHTVFKIKKRRVSGKHN